MARCLGTGQHQSAEARLGRLHLLGAHAFGPRRWLSLTAPSAEDTNTCHNGNRSAL